MCSLVCFLILFNLMDCWERQVWWKTRIWFGISGGGGHSFFKSYLCYITFSSCSEVLISLGININGFRSIQDNVFSLFSLNTMFSGLVIYFLCRISRLRTWQFPLLGLAGLILRCWSSPGSFCKIGSLLERTCLNKSNWWFWRDLLSLVWEFDLAVSRLLWVNHVFVV